MENKQLKISFRFVSVRKLVPLWCWEAKGWKCLAYCSASIWLVMPPLSKLIKYRRCNLNSRLLLRSKRRCRFVTAHLKQRIGCEAKCLIHMKSAHSSRWEAKAYSSAGLRSCIRRASRILLSSRKGCFILMSITTPDSWKSNRCHFKSTGTHWPATSIRKHIQLKPNDSGYFKVMFTPHLTKILCYTEHPLSIQVLHDRLAQVFLSLWGVPHRLCHHSTDLGIKVLRGMTKGFGTRVLHVGRAVLRGRIYPVDGFAHFGNTAVYVLMSWRQHLHRFLDVLTTLRHSLRKNWQVCILHSWGNKKSDLHSKCLWTRELFRPKTPF